MGLDDCVDADINFENYTDEKPCEKEFEQKEIEAIQNYLVNIPLIHSAGQCVKITEVSEDCEDE